jgi:CubicO group peptidase (beta-lactamase class C family)
VSDQPRSLPGQPSLRFLKIEAKRRLAAGEFTTLQLAQLAIAREHGQPSWTALKQLIDSEPRMAGRALAQVRWVISRFDRADGPGWQAPGDSELREHFSGHFLTAIPPGQLVSTLSQRAALLREELVVTDDTPLAVRAQIGGLQVEAVAEDGPPHLLRMLRVYPAGGRVTDVRVAAPATRTSGDVPAPVPEIADSAFSELGLAGLVLAGSGGADGQAWTVARGWADLDRAEVLRPDHRFPAYSITKLITATAVLRLVAAGQLNLDDAANEYLRTVRLGNDAVTVRDLLAHAGGVDSPEELFAPTVPDLVTLTGPVLSCSGERGTFLYSNGGYAALGQLIADVTGSPYADAARRLVLDPLAMTGALFPVRWPDPDSAAVTGYQLEPDGSFEPAPARLCTMPAAGGLWATAADLVRFGVSWPTLLPAALAREAVTLQAARTPGVGHVGLGWILNQPLNMAGHQGGGLGAATSLITLVGRGQAYAALASRLIPIEPVNARVIRALTQA